MADDEKMLAAIAAARQAKPSPKPAVGARRMMHVRVASPFKVFFDEEAYSITGLNAAGPFDILPQHTILLVCLMPVI